MSDKKQVIHVKDLVIKADNVSIERPHRQDPIFGNRRGRTEEAEGNQQHEHHEHEESREHNRDEQKNERRPFWF